MKTLRPVGSTRNRKPGLSVSFNSYSFSRVGACRITASVKVLMAHSGPGRCQVGFAADWTCATLFVTTNNNMQDMAVFQRLSTPERDTLGCFVSNKVNSK